MYNLVRDLFLIGVLAAILMGQFYLMDSITSLSYQITELQPQGCVKIISGSIVMPVGRKT